MTEHAEDGLTSPPILGEDTVQSPVDIPQDLLLVIFIHGQVQYYCEAQLRLTLASSSFKGTDSTFATFPERMQHVLSETISNVHVESVVFPAYEVRYSRP